MGRYQITAPDGRVVVVEGPAPPNDSQIAEIFSSLPPKTASPPPDKTAFDWIKGGPEAQLSSVDKGVYQAVKGVVSMPFQIAQQQAEAAAQGNPLALIPGGPTAAAMAQQSVGEAQGAVQSARQGDILSALHQALSAVPGIGGVYKDMATDVIRGNPDVAAGKALGGYMAGRVIPDVVPPAAQAAGAGIQKAAQVAEAAAPYAKATVSEAGPVVAGAALDWTLGGNGTTGGLIGEVIKRGVNRAAREKASAEKAVVAAESQAAKAAAKAEAAAQKDSFKAASLEAKILEAADKAKAANTKAIEADSMKSGGIEARILEMSQKAQAQAEAELAAAVKAMENEGTRNAARAEAQLKAAQDKAAKAAERTQKAQERADAAQIRREYRQRTQMDKAASKEAAKAQPADSPVLNQVEGKPAEPAPVTPAAPAEIIKGIEVAPVAKSTLEKATSLSNTLGKKGYDAAAIEAQLLKSHPTLDTQMAKKLASSAPKPEAISYQDAALSLADKNWTPSEIAAKLINQEGLTHNQALKAAYDSVMTRTKMTPEQAAEIAQMKGKNLKKVRLEDIKPGRKPGTKPLDPSPDPNRSGARFK